jgi:transaldolase
MSEKNPLQRLASFGQSVWLDFIERGFIREGDLRRLIEKDAVSGVTSNPAIFQKAIAKNQTYEDSIARELRSGRSVAQIHEALIIEDIIAAADELKAVYKQTDGRDGFVSLEVSPLLARDTEGTYREAKQLWARVDRENLMVKVPGTTEGVSAVRRLIADGININITLLFSVDRYAEVHEAYLQGLEDRVRQNQPIDRIASVASFFLSRIDTLLDPQLAQARDAEIKKLIGECALTCARAAYAKYCETVASARWKALASRGAKPQRLLWASTGTKNPSYSDVKYVEALIGPETVTTLPPETLDAYRDHGDPAVRLQCSKRQDTDMAAMQAQLERAGIDWHAVAMELEEDGIKKFVAPHEAILATLSERIAR